MPDARREAEWILCRLLRTDRGGVVARRPDALSADDAAHLASLVKRRAGREPFQYLFGEQEFRGLTFRVDRRVLVPRPETEQLVEVVLRAGVRTGSCVADLGTGSGCIAVSLAWARPDLRLFALDRSDSAIALAAENAARHGVAARIAFRVGDFEHPPADWLGAMDAIVSNPPYVSEEEWVSLAPEVRDHEPKDALVPGPVGDEAYGAMAPAVHRLLRPHGLAVVELGWRSEPAARDAFARSGFDGIVVEPDARGIPRVLRAVRCGA